MPKINIGEFTILHMQRQGEPTPHLQVIQPTKVPAERLAVLLHDFLADAVTGNLLQGLNLNATNGKNRRLVADELLNLMEERLLNDGLNSESTASYVLISLLHAAGDRKVLGELSGIPLTLWISYNKPPLEEVKIEGLREPMTAACLLMKAGFAPNEDRAKIILMRRLAHLNGVRLTVEPGELKILSGSVLQVGQKAIRLRGARKHAPN